MFLEGTLGGQESLKCFAKNLERDMLGLPGSFGELMLLRERTMRFDPACIAVLAGTPFAEAMTGARGARPFPTSGES